MIKLKTIHSGYFKLDGGAMFGVVPKTLWKNINPADDENMCTWAMRCLLIEIDNRVILIDTGMGDKQDDKFKSFFHPHGPETLLGSLSAHGYKTEDITDVFLTHLHFDHVGGAVMLDSNGKLKPTFPNAKYWTNKKHYDWAYAANPREAASFLKENFVPLLDAGVLKFLPAADRSSWFDGIDIMICYGHTEAMMLPIIQFGDKTVVYCADLLPSAGHIGLPYVMSYDIRPLDTLKEKSNLLNTAAERNWYLFLEHDKDHEVITVKRNEKGRVVLDKSYRLDELTTN